MVVPRCWPRPDGQRNSRCSPTVVLLLLGVFVGACGGEPVAQPPPTTATSVGDTIGPIGTTTLSAPTTIGTGSTTSTVAQPTTTATRPTTTTRRPTTTAKDQGGLGAPFDIPPIVDTQGFSKAEAREAAEGAFNRACGIDPCRVTFVDVDPEPRGVDCPIVFSGRTDPPKNTRVRRGSVVKLLFMYSNSCDPAVG